MHSGSLTLIKMCTDPEVLSPLATGSLDLKGQYYHSVSQSTGYLGARFCTDADTLSLFRSSAFAMCVGHSLNVQTATLLLLLRSSALLRVAALTSPTPILQFQLENHVWFQGTPGCSRARWTSSLRCRRSYDRATTRRHLGGAATMGSGWGWGGEVRYHYIREKCEDGSITMVYIKSADNVADILTKPLAKP